MGETQDDLLTMPRCHGAWQFAFDETTEQLNKAERETVLQHVSCGTVTVTVAGQELQAGAGQLLIMPPGLCHDYMVAAGTRSIGVCCALCRFEFDDTPRVLALSDDEAAVSWIKDLTVFHAPGNRQREVTDYLLAAILARLKQIGRRDVALRALHPGVAAALQYLDDNIATRLTLGDVAAQAHISPSHLRTLFHRQVGSGVLRYQQDRRMQLALELLDQPHLSLQEIARRCGYNDAEYFGRLFQRYHNITPARFRRRSPAR
jgi:AraC-like DNA-binding protein